MRPPRPIGGIGELADDLQLRIETDIGMRHDPIDLTHHRRADQCHWRHYPRSTQRFDVLNAGVADRPVRLPEAIRRQSPVTLRLPW